MAVTGTIDTLCLTRPLVEDTAFRTWACSLGLSDPIQPSAYHLTLAYSVAKVSWPKVAEMAGKSCQEELQLPEDHGRSIVRLGDEGWIALRVEDPRFHARFNDVIAAGGSWGWPSYLPHVTLGLDASFDINGIGPFAGPLVFGPEHFDRTA